jgi:predicted NBD/HSP70 family sugar kinase
MTVSSERVATEDTNLRKRLIRTAYALHFTAGQTASLFEQYAGSVTLPLDVDGAVGADRWRVLAERALEIAHACDRRAANSHLADLDFADCCQRDASGHPDVSALAELATRHLSAAAMTVEAMLPFVEVPTRGRLDGAVEQIDATIRDLRD